jgi:hypothetical protein
MTTDPRTAALAEALHAKRIGCMLPAELCPPEWAEEHRNNAAAILAALDGWGTLVSNEYLIGLNRQITEAMGDALQSMNDVDEIARLRKIEEAARALITAKDAREELDSYEALRAALEAEG